MKKPRVTEHSQSWGKPIQNHHLLFCAILSLVVHLLVVTTFLALRKPIVIQVEEGFTVTLSSHQTTRVETQINITQTSQPNSLTKSVGRC